MNKKVLKYLAVVFIVAGGTLFLIRAYNFLRISNIKDDFKEADYEPVLGFYDRSGNYTNSKAENICPYSFEWLNFKEDISSPLLKTAISAKHQMLINIKMWYTSNMFNKYTNVLEATVNGDYDDKIKKLCSLLSGNDKTVYLRFNPEMEVPVSHFPWQSQSPELYVKAFRHFAQLSRKNAPNVKMVWGPAGYPGSLEFYPGDDVVDVASITLGSESERLTNAYPKSPSVANEIMRKLHRLRFVDKPVFIMGSLQVKKDTFNTSWIDVAVSNIKKDTITYSENNFIRPENNISSRVATPLIIGVYDPRQLLTNQKAVSAEHIFTDWSEIENGNFRKEFDKVISRHHDVIVTMEPWKSKKQQRDSNVLINTINGHFDSQIGELYKILSSTERIVYLRCLHEMEIPVHRYPWQSQDPIAYIKAFRYIMLFDKKSAKNIRRIWGPAGDRGFEEWWPGNDVVDYISIAIYGLPDKNITDFKKQESFETIFERKFYRMRFINKPIFITEFGVKGPEDYKTKWLQAAAVTINKNPQIAGISYFNFFDTPKAWGKIKPPDWGITKETFSGFISNLKNKIFKL